MILQITKWSLIGCVMMSIALIACGDDDDESNNNPFDDAPEITSFTVNGEVITINPDGSTFEPVDTLRATPSTTINVEVSYDLKGNTQTNLQIVAGSSIDTLFTASVLSADAEGSIDNINFVISENILFTTLRVNLIATDQPVEWDSERLYIDVIQ